MATPKSFLNFPREIRLVVYDYLFAGSRLYIDIPRRLENNNKTKQARRHRKSISQGAAIPGILLASRFLRCDATPVYSSHLTAIVCTDLPWWMDYSNGNARMVSYLAETRIMEYNDCEATCIDDARCPKLQTIILTWSNSSSSVSGTLLDHSLEEFKAYYWRELTEQFEPALDLMQRMINFRLGQIRYGKRCSNGHVKGDVIVDGSQASFRFYKGQSFKTEVRLDL